MCNNFSIFKKQNWFFKKYDGRRKEFKNIDRTSFDEAKERHFSRVGKSYSRDAYRSRREFIEFFANLPYEYQGDGMDDYNMYQRPSSNGVGYVAICPGERGNNFYVDDPLLVDFLKKKYNKWKGL